MKELSFLNKINKKSLYQYLEKLTELIKRVSKPTECLFNNGFSRYDMYMIYRTYMTYHAVRLHS